MRKPEEIQQSIENLISDSNGITRQMANNDCTQSERDDLFASYTAANYAIQWLKWVLE